MPCMEACSYFVNDLTITPSLIQLHPSIYSVTVAKLLALIASCHNGNIFRYNKADFST
jgi:hypothetical protein